MDIVKFMNRKNLKYADVADFCGITVGMVSALRGGRSKPSYDLAKKLIQMGISLEELFDKETAEKITENEFIGSSIDVSKLPADICAEIVRKGFENLKK